MRVHSEQTEFEPGHLSRVIADRRADTLVTTSSVRGIPIDKVLSV
jgi:hypothetical protein